MKGKFHGLWGVFGVLVLWLTGTAILGQNIIPSPMSVLKNMPILLTEDKLLLHVLMSLYRLIVALILALIIGVSIGVSLGMNSRLKRLLMPTVNLLFPVPKVAFLPVIFAIWGLGDHSKIVMIFLVLVFQLIMTCHDAVVNFDAPYMVAAQSLKLSRKNILRHVILPGISPSILSTVRLNIGTGLAILFFAEAYGTSLGIGYFIMNKWSLIEFDAMYGGIIVMGILGWALLKGIDWIERYCCSWSCGES